MFLCLRNKHKLLQREDKNCFLIVLEGLLFFNLKVTNVILHILRFKQASLLQTMGNPTLTEL